MKEVLTFLGGVAVIIIIYCWVRIAIEILKGNKGKNDASNSINR